MGNIFPAYNGRCMKLATNLCKVPELSMIEARTLLPAYVLIACTEIPLGL